MSGTFAGPIVVGVDGSPSASNAVRWAAEEAAQRHRMLKLVHALDEYSLRYPMKASAPGESDVAGMFSARGRRLLGEAREVARQASAEVAVETALSERRPAEALRAESAAAGLLVLGSTGIRPLGRALLGSVSIALAAHAKCPVALIRPHAGEDPPAAGEPVVVGVDGSPAGDAALELAFDEASWRQVPLVAVHVWDDAFLAELFEEARSKLDRPAVEQHEHELLGQRLAGWQEKYPDVTVRRLVVRGRPGDELLSVADRAQLLVVGSRGRGGLTGMLLGSTSQAVMSYALCPVVVTRAED
ncbi:MAG TPA: universal stress protein [Amycolatopsis sp.]|nr:universal stress protein [Amycolatopsis sp.]